MNSGRLFLLVVSLPITFFAIGTRPAGLMAQDRVTVQPRRIVIHRSGKLAHEFPERRKAIIRYPFVIGLSDATVLRRVQNTLRMKNVFHSSLEEYRQDAWLEEFDYKVNYNKNYLLDITFTQSGMGAYPDIQRKPLSN
jgi:hypothetical protein